jgi:putative tricarboxylic transport membrane protein
MLPFLYHMSVIPAITLMLATQAASYYAASITAILLNTPGAPESYPTTLDGFPMAQKGQAGRALAISATSTWAGGWIGCVVLLVLIPISGTLVSIFHPPEFVAIIVLALVLIGGTGEGASAGKVLLSGAIGLMLSFIGADPVTGIDRFTFGSVSLMSGLNVVPFALGVFAMTQMVVMYGRNESVSGAQALLKNAFRRQVGQGIGDAAREWVHILRSALVASVLGLIPGIGGFSANFISYSLGRQVSRKSGSKFGTGVPAGIASAEGSSLAKEVGSLVPAVALGLPSGVGMVIFIAALSILGVQPGPTLLKTDPTLPYSMMWIMAIAGLLSCAIGLLITPWLSRATNIRGPVMMPVIITLAVLGSFAAVTGFIGVVELGVFAAIGVVLRKLGYSLAAMTIGLVLGGTFADNLHLTETIYGWGFLTSSPLADVFFAITIGLLVWITWRGRKGRAVVTPDRAARGPRAAHPVLEPVTEAVIAAVSIIYMVVAFGYASGAGTVPAIIAGLAAVIALFRLITHAVAAVRARLSGAPASTAAVSTAAGSSSLESTALESTALGSSALGSTALGGTATIEAPEQEQLPAPEEALATIPAERETAGAGSGDRSDGAFGSSEFGEPPAGPHAGRDPQYSGPTDETPEAERSRRRNRLSRELGALGWIWGAILAAYLFSFAIGVPLAILLYCLFGVKWTRRWQRLLYAGVVTCVSFGVCYIFISLFSLTFNGLLI